MFGLLIALIILGFNAITGSAGLGVIAAANFLWVWYWIFAILSIGIISVVGLMMTVGGGVVGLNAGINSGNKAVAMALSLAGMGAGASVSLAYFLRIIIRNTIKLIGAYLLMGSFIAATGTWVIPNLIIGSIMIFVGVVMLYKKKSSSSSK